MSIQAGDTIAYVSYGNTKTAIVSKMTNGGLTCLIGGGRFVHVESVNKIVKRAA